MCARGSGCLFSFAPEMDLDPAWALLGQGVWRAVIHAPFLRIQASPHPWAGVCVCVTMGLCLWGQKPSGAAERKDSNSQEGNGPQTDTQGAGGLLVDVTWSTENEPITDLRGNHPDEQPVPGGGQMVTRLPILSPRNVQGNAK